MVAACPAGDGPNANGCGLRPPGCTSRESGRYRWFSGCGCPRSRPISGVAGGGPVGIRRWRRWGPGGATCRLSDVQLDRLRTELARGPAEYGWADQRWTLARVAVLIGRLFHVRYTLRGTSYLLHRNGFTVQVPARRAAERNEAAITTWRTETWAKVRG